MSYRIALVATVLACGGGEKAPPRPNRPTTTAAALRALGLPALAEMKLICDFEGQIEWVLGVTAAAAPYRISERLAPARLVLEIRHAP